MAQQFDIVGNLLLKVDGAEAGVNKLRNSLSKLTLPKNIDSGLKKSFSNLDELFAKYKAQLKDGFQTKSDVTTFTKTAKAISAEYDKIGQKLNQLNNTNVTFNVKSDALKDAEKNLNKLLEAKNKLAKDTQTAIGKDLENLTKAGSRSTNAKDLANQLGVAINNGEMQKALELAERLRAKMVDLKSAKDSWSKMSTGTSLTDTLDKVVTACQKGATGFDNLEKETQEAIQVLTNLQTGDLEKLSGILDGLNGDWEKNTSAMRAASGEMQEYARSSQSMSQQLGDLQQSTQYFFSLRNMINLFRRGIDDAIQSVKELDKAMTDTAVVTDYKVSDMWNMLPQYTQIANELGATTQGAYETMTLYFQQGLDQQQAFELGAETMKMARIAGLDYAETTDMMTAALRGFNMELNETSARRINDVYSKLAAVTASDTEELGTAMQRTASIAHSAGMSFEGTTAFLAQAIETTREPAENIGTAMKTIIARFQEMKKNPLEISEVEGEEVDFNKVDTALKTIGVDLKDTNGQFRELDKVFLDISERWNGLSQTQQRYIATTAAGSRQQSRFIAMMDNYDRTMELVNAANNSAGASNEQFNKTMDSLEAKLNRLHNAWQAFTMGIANNGMIKLAVDGVTNLLTVTNKLIDTLSLGSGALKSFLSIFMAFNGLKATGKIANALIGGLGGMVDPQSSFAAGFRGGAIGKNSAQAINQPIVQELQSIRSLIAQKINQTDLGKGSVTGPYDEYNRFKQARTNIAGLNKENTVKDLTKQLVGVSGKNQNLLMRGNAATFQAATNSLISSYGIKNLKEVKAGERFLNDQRKSAQITAEEYYSALQDPGLLKQAMVKAGIQQNNPAYAYMDGLDQAITIKAKDLQDQAIKQAKYAAAETGRGTKEVFDKITQGLTTDKAGEYFRQKAISEQGLGLDKTKLNTSKMGAILNGIGSIGTGISQAGMGIQAFGNILVSSANPALQAFGSALTSIGGLIGGLGMGISGISSAFTAISGSKLITNIAGTGTIFGGLMSVAGALTGGLLLLGGVIAALVIGIKKHNDNIKKAAEEVSTKYQGKNEKAQTNISNLQSWREDFARLSSGVDVNGYNINLSTEDYDRYLEITRGIAEINPSIVEGYNAQGQAIITNNKALEETLELEKQHQQEAFKEYTSPESLKKLIAARDLSKQAKVAEQEGTVSQWGVQTKTKTTVATGEVEFKPQATMRKQAQKIGETLQKGIKEGWATEDLLADFNIDIGKLAEGDEDTLRKFDQFGPKIQQRINDSMDSAGDDIKEHTKNTMLDAFSGYSDAADELDELITPTYNALLAATVEYANAIPSEFKKYFNEGLKDIASDANVRDPLKAAQEFAGHFETLTKEGGDYYQVLQDIEKAQDDYATTLEKDTYDAFAANAVDRLNAIRNELGENIDLTQGYGKAISEFIDNEIAKVTSFTQQGAANLKQALNTMVDEIAAAEGALESFNKVAEGTTYGKAAANISQIYETATSDEHILGEGDQVFWAGAEAVVGRKNLLENGKATKDSALKQMKEVQEMLKGGQEGWDNFKIKWFDSYDAGLLKDIQGLTFKDNGWIDTIDENLNPEVYEQIADALNMSKDSLIAMLNLGRQFGEVDFSNIQDIRKALATSENTIKNPENGTVFVKQDFLESEMTSAGLDLNKQQQIEEDLQKNYNTELIKSVDEIAEDSSQLTRMGIKDMESLIKTFDATGQFTKDEIAKYADAYAKSQDKEFNEAEFNKIWEQNQTDREFGGIPSSLTSIESILSSIESLIAGKDLAEGRLTKSTTEDAKKWLYGETGVLDTDAQKFWKGQGANGAITEAEFNKTSQELTDFINRGTDYLNNLEEAKQKAIDNEDYAELQKIETERLAYKNMLDWANKFLTEGTEAYNNQNPQQNSQDWQYGNVTQANRPQGLTDDYGNTVTVLGGSKSFDIGNGIEKEIAFTPVVKLNGKGTILEDDTVDAYINALITQIQSEGKEVNLNELLQLDSTGKIEGFEGIKNVIADVGDTAAITAIQMHALEAGLDVTAINQQYQALSSTIKKVGDEADAAGAKNEKTTNGNLKSSTDVQATTYEVFTAGAEGNIDALTEKLTYLKENYPEVHSELIAEFPQYGELETYSEEIQKLDNKEVQQTVTASIANQGTLTGLSDDLSNLNNKNPNIKVTVDEGTSASQLKKLDKDANKLDDTKHLKINVQKTGVSSITVDGHTWTISTKAKGQNNHGYFALPSFGSAAKGRYGQLGPKGKGGLTLTGELGYEVAWLPSENRSMILGANGPQMLNLPNDAVVWDHEQSKKILQQKAIPAGSHYVQGKDADDPRGGSGKSNNSKKGKKGKKNKKKKSKDNSEKEAQKLFEAVNVWWDNFSRRAEARQRISDKLSKDFQKTLKGFAGTAGAAKTALKEYQTALIASAKENSIAYNQANAQLTNLDQGIGSNALGLISYSVTKGKGKKQKTTSKQEFVNLGAYIDFNEALGTYEINQAALDTIANLEQRKAIADAANQKLNDLLSKRNNAEDAIQKAREELDNVANTMYETFYAWEKSITEIYVLSKRLELLSSTKDFRSDLIDFESAMIKAGYDTASEGQKKIEKYLSDQQQDLTQQIQTAGQLIDLKENDFQKALQASTYAQAMQESADENGVISQNAIDKFNAAIMALDLYNSSGGDLGAAIEKLNQQGLNEEQYNLVKSVFDDIGQKEADVVSASQEATKLSTELLTKIEEANDFIIDFQNDMLDGMKEQAEKQIDELDKLNDSLTKALKDLLDDVKKKLDERRREEDNAKTESDISQKQQRLAALQADTSGGHQVEIAQLQKEIAESQQSYQRSLEDQLLDDLQNQADEAERQRQQQIDLLQGANELAYANGVTMAQIEEWLAKGDEASKNALKEAYRNAQGYYKDNISKKEQERIDKEFEESYAKYGAYVQALPSWEKTAKNSALTAGAVKHAEDTVNNLPNTKVDVDRSQGDKFIADSELKRQEREQAMISNDTSAAAGPTPYDIYLTNLKAVKDSGAITTAQVNTLFDLGAAAGKGPATVLLDIVDGKPFSWKNAFHAIIDAKGISRYTLVKTWPNGAGGTFTDALATLGNPDTITEIKKKSKYTSASPLAFKTGGLADYTGPAWLDGTPSKPELVLNAKDTQNFLVLRDVLSKALGSTNSISNDYEGDILYEININVDKIEKDYDVDKVVDRVKKEITKGAGYRNVTQVRNFR